MRGARHGAGCINEPGRNQMANSNVLGNRIALQIPEADVQAIRAAIQVLQAQLLPHLVDLDADARRELPKMGTKTVEFVDKAFHYAEANPQLRPAFVDLEEFQRDLDAVKLLVSLQQPLAQVADMVDDSLMLAGSEAYAAALSFYQATKSAAKLNVPAAGTIAQDLAAQFASRGMRTTDPAPGGVSRAALAPSA
jgi:hypothetical protein